MALPRKKPVLVHWTSKKNWRLGPFWFDYGTNVFTREQYKKFEFKPLFIRQVSSGKAVVEDPERVKTQAPAAIGPKKIEDEIVAVESAGDETSESGSKRRGRRKDIESAPS